MGKCQIDIPAKLHTKAKLIAVKRSVTLRKLLILALEQSCAGWRKG